MTYFPSVYINSINDSPNMDAFHRLKTSEPFSLFDYKQIGDNSLFPIYYATKSLNGGSSTFSSNRASTTLQTPAVSGSKMVLQTRRRMNYQPGKGLSIIKTFVPGTGSLGIVKRFGYFDENNGFYFEVSGTNTNIVLRSNVSGTVSETRVSQSSWSEHTFNDTETDISALNLNKIQIFFIDFQWLGAGRIRTGFFQNGVPILAHEFNFANQNSSVYLSNPNLPIRDEIENYSNSSTNSSEIICVSVQSDGGYQPAGFHRSVDRNVSAKTFATGSLKPAISLRLASGSAGSNIKITELAVLPTSNDTLKYSLVLNPIYSSADNPVWTTISGSMSQYDINRDGSIVGGYVLDSGYLAATNNSKISILREIASDIILGSDIDGISDEIVLAISPITTNVSVLAGISYVEY